MASVFRLSRLALAATPIRWLLVSRIRLSCLSLMLPKDPYLFSQLINCIDKEFYEIRISPANTFIRDDLMPCHRRN